MLTISPVYAVFCSSCTSNSKSKSTAALHLIINKLEKGLKNENKTAILEAYEEARALDLELVDGKTFDKYDSLIGKCNDFLYQ